MGSSKIKPVHVYLIGGVLMLIIGVGLYFAVLKPVNDEIEVVNGQIAAERAKTVSVDNQPFTIAQRTAAEDALKKAEIRKNERKATLAALEVRKQLPSNERLEIAGDTPGLITNTLPRWFNLPQVVVQRMERYAQQSARKHGVTVTTQFSGPSPGTNPDSIPRQIIAWTLGGMTVEGEFNRVMAWVRDWNNAPLLVSVDGLRCQLAGRNGRVVATAGLSAFVFPTGPGAAKWSGQQQQAAAGAGAGAFPAGPVAGGAGIGDVSTGAETPAGGVAATNGP
jgi:hypothetical protein